MLRTSLKTKILLVFSLVVLAGCSEQRMRVYVPIVDLPSGEISEAPEMLSAHLLDRLERVLTYNCVSYERDSLDSLLIDNSISLELQKIYTANANDPVWMETHPELRACSN